MRCIIVENPGIAWDIARALGTPRLHRGYVAVGHDCVIWVDGPLLRLAGPAAYDPQWTLRDWITSPLLPEVFQDRPVPKTRAQLEIVLRLIQQATDVVCAMGADPDGERIFRHIYRWADVQKSVVRLLLSETTPSAIRQGLAASLPLTTYDNRAHAAEARAQADWLIGLNVTHALASQHGRDVMRVDRIGTPTLQLIADRDDTIALSPARRYWQVAITCHTDHGDYRALWQGADPCHPDRIADPGRAGQILAQLRSASPGVIKEVEYTPIILPSPLLFSLSDLQKEAHRCYGFTVAQVLDAAYTLYYQHLTSDPYTASRRITPADAPTVAHRLAALIGEAAYAPWLRSLTQPLTTVRSLHEADSRRPEAPGAIIPTGQTAATNALPLATRQIYDLICQRFIAALLPVGQDERATIITQVRDQTFKTVEIRAIAPGWRDVWPQPPRTADAARLRVPPELAPGEDMTVSGVEVIACEAPPASALTDASLLGLMEQYGLGTLTTRSRILETLIENHYVERRQHTLHTTPQGRRLLAAVPKSLKSPLVMGRWEARLQDIAAGTDSAPAVMASMRDYIKDLAAQGWR